MRVNTFLLLSCLVSSVYAAEQQERQHVPPPPLPDMNGGSTDQEPQVTITKQTGQTIEEYRIGGRLYMIKIIPKHGKPYYLVDDRGDGRFARQEGLDSGVRPPQWVIHRF
jgi:hypothetical protein